MNDEILEMIAVWVEKTWGRDVSRVTLSKNRKTALCWGENDILVKAVDIRSFTTAFIK